MYMTAASFVSVNMNPIHFGKGATEEINKFNGQLLVPIKNAGARAAASRGYETRPDESFFP